MTPKKPSDSINPIGWDLRLCDIWYRELGLYLNGANAAYINPTYGLVIRTGYYIAPEQIEQLLNAAKSVWKKHNVESTAESFLVHKYEDLYASQTNTTSK